MCGYALLCSREVSCYDFIECRVIGLEFLTGVHGIMYSVDRISFLVHIEPALHALGPILVDVAAGICVDPFSCSESRIKRSLQLCIDLRIYRDDSELMDSMGEF